MLNRLSRLSPLQRLKRRIQARPDTEFQQALLRFIIGVTAYLYFSSSWLDHPEYVTSSIHFVALFFLSTSALILAGTLISPAISTGRRLVGAVVDFATASFLLLIGGETSAPLVGIYLWVILGNGFRYGVRYLYFSTALASLGFTSVLFFNAFWHQHLALGIGILFTMVIVPLYAASLTQQLHAAVKRANEASQAKSNFLANMSHELRTPLNGVIGVADLLSETKLDKEQREFAQIIHASAHTLLELIDNVLDISRIEAGRINILPENFDLHRLVNGTVSILDSQARGKGLVLAAHIAPQTPFHLNGDARHLRQILINLVGNAIKFTEYGRVDIYIRPVGQSRAPQRLRFEVVDTGIGIPESSQARIFESFTQADASVTRRFGGTGLGTAIAKQLVETLGGQIGLRSQVGEGTTLWFELPFTLSETQSSPSQPRFDAPMRVAVLASNELSNRVQSLIGAWGGETVVADNTTRLAAELTSGSPAAPHFAAVVVERSVLPSDPVAFLHLLRDAPQMAHLPIILIESDASTNPSRDIQWVLDGFASVLRTPVNPTLLFNAIHAVLSNDMPDNVVSLANHYQAQATHTGPLNILVAEDNPVNQRVICGLLKYAGHQVFLASDGEEALAMLEANEHDYSLAIVDMHMPLLSGPEVVQRWRFMEDGHLPVIILTADARSDAQAACKEAGADAFLTKPVNSRDLVNAIARLAPGAVENVGHASPNQSNPLEELDESILDNLNQIGGAGFVQDLLTSFEDDSQRALGAIERALVDDNFGQWHDQMHMLKGGASDVGASQLAALCSEAERIKPYELSGPVAREKLEQIRLALIATQAALIRYLDQKLRAESI